MKVLTCVYCGKEYPEDTPNFGVDILTEHIRACEKHPLRAAEAQIKMLRSALIGLVGASDKAELEAMEAAMRAVPAPESDKANAINAIHAILATTPAEAKTQEAA